MLNLLAAHDDLIANHDEDDFLNGDVVGDDLMINNDANNGNGDDFLNCDIVIDELMINNDVNNVNEDNFFEW